MSRNFELLQQIGKEQEVLPTQPEAQAAPADVNRAQPQLEGTQADELVRLVQSMFLLPPLKSHRMVMFTSAEPGSGCSWICFHASVILASRVAGSVCVVDANL